jgi:hypothetical protein
MPVEPPKWELVGDHGHLFHLAEVVMAVSTHCRIGVRHTLAASLLVAAAACGGDSTKPVGPNLPGDPGPGSAFKQASFILDIDTKSGNIKITAPAKGISNSASLDVTGGLGRPSFSILAGDAVQLVASNYSASAVGALIPGKVRVTFDISVLNKLPGIQLVTPTFPTPPAGASGVLLFPFEVATITTSGGVTVGGDGTEVIVDQPSNGAVVPSDDWDGDGAPGSGSPHNFFNDNGCAAGNDDDCYRWESYVSPLAPGATSETRSIGFDIDPTVGQFRARLIVAADLAPGTALTGAIAGTVTSPQRGAIAGAAISVSSGEAASTDAAGAYSIAGVNVGPKTVSVGNLPAGCSVPASQSVTVTSGGTASADFSVTCSVPSGLVSGTITSSLGGGITGAQVVVTPTGGSAQPAVASNASGAYSVANVPVGTTGDGTVALGNLPANCTDPGPGSYSGLTNGGSVTVDFTVACTAPPAGYQYGVTWSISGTQAIATLRLDMAAFDDPAIAGADGIASFQANFSYDASKLTFASANNVPGAASFFDAQTVNGGTPGVISFISASGNAADRFGDVGVVQFVFNIIGSGSVTSSSAIVEAINQSFFDLLPRVIVNEGTINLP